MTSELVRQLGLAGIRLFLLPGGRIRVRGPKARVTAEVLAEVERCKPLLLRELGEQTWLVYPDSSQVACDPIRLVSVLLSGGVHVDRLEGGVIAATGPSSWFSEVNRRALRQRAVTLAAHLDAASPAAPAPDRITGREGGDD